MVHPVLEEDDVINPATGEVLATEILVSPDDVHEAMAAARASFTEW